MPAFINTLRYSAYEQIRRNYIHLFVVNLTEINAVKTKDRVEIVGQKRNEDKMDKTHNPEAVLLVLIEEQNTSGTSYVFGTILNVLRRTDQETV
jgi:hypothetical protein